jgi:hypothetical protein
MSCAVAVDGQDIERLTDRLLQAYPLKTSLASIGHVYWEEGGNVAWAGSRSLTSVFEAFLSHIDLERDELRRAPSSALRGIIQVGTVRDFSDGRTVKVRGWLLSETEARLCAMAAIRMA